MASDTSTAQGYEKYYVPESSSLAVRATIGLVLSVFGAALVLNDMTYGREQEASNSVWVLTAGLVFFVLTLASWFGTVIKENMAGMNSGQLNQSYVLGMFWFIFSEVMFFAAFFGALLYVRQFAGPWLAGEGDGGRMSGLLWPGFEFSWPPVSTPQEVVGGVDAQVIANNGAFVSQEKSMAPADAHAWYAWVPVSNTLILLASSATVHVAHTALLADDRQKFNRWLGITVGLALVFLVLQAAEYYEAYADFGLTLNSGIYGSTFFMLTGFHGFHVAMGMTMLLVQLVRSLKNRHFTATDHFGFEASSWYWHFVDVVWVFLFLFVYIL